MVLWSSQPYQGRKCLSQHRQYVTQSLLMLWPEYLCSPALQTAMQNVIAQRGDKISEVNYTKHSVILLSAMVQCWHVRVYLDFSGEIHEVKIFCHFPPPSYCHDTALFISKQMYSSVCFIYLLKLHMLFNYISHDFLYSENPFLHLHHYFCNLSVASTVTILFVIFNSSTISHPTIVRKQCHFSHNALSLGQCLVIICTNYDWRFLRPLWTIQVHLESNAYRFTTGK